MTVTDRKITPMLASPATEIPSGIEWIAQTKYDGWRAIFRKGDHEDLQLFTRSGKRIDTVPYIAEALAGVPDNTILDGEIVNLTGAAEWNRTEELLSRNAVHVPSAGDPPLTYVIFDVIELDGETLIAEPLESRLKLLKLLGKLTNADENVVRVAEDVVCVGNAAEELYERLVGEGHEGIVCKHLKRGYAPGARNGAWVKIKPVLEMDVEVTGAYDPTPGSRLDGTHAGGLTFHAVHNDGTTYDGRAAGMSDALRKGLFENPDSFKGMVAVVAYQSVGKDGALRFPRFIRFRDPADKPVDELTTPAPTSHDASQAKGFLMERLVELEDENAQLREENKDLRVKLNAALALDTAEQEGATRKRRAPRKADAGANRPKTVRSVGGRPRNFGAMADLKLRSCVAGLRAGRGDAYERAVASGQDPAVELRRAEACARQRGVTI